MPTTPRVSRWLAITLCFGLAASLGVGAQGGPADLARAYVTTNRQQFGLSASDVQDIAVSSVVPSRHNGVTHVYLQQRYRGLEVYHGLISAAVGANGTVISVSSRFVANIAAAASGDARTDGPAGASLVWAPLDGGGVRLAWKIASEEAEALVDAETGATLDIVDLVDHDAAEALVASTARLPGSSPSALSLAAVAAGFDPTDGATYRVFPLPFESPSDGDRALVSNAADPVGSPFGWHDTDGVDGPEFTVTRGNNAHAYTDVDANNQVDPGSDPDGGGTLTFDFPLDLSQNPEHYRPAAVANLFYWNNIIHDVMYRYGFDEGSGNFQQTNYSGDGLGEDYVRAEAQDGSGTNNANFNTNADGIRPRMQMFVWTNPLPNFVTITEPAAIAGDYAASRASFGAQLTDVGPISGQVVLVDDGGGLSPTDGCEPYTVPQGAIALVYRGNCEFGVKGLNAQNAGAAAAIVANNAPGEPIVMGPGVVGDQVDIALVMVSQEHGDLFAANSPLSGTLRPNPLTSINRDSDLDAGVITHEYGHGISNRLTGGPAVTGCLSNAEQMGEGWSDFFATVLTASAADRPTTARGLASYVAFQPADGRGIRPTPYSTDMTVNPSTYASVADPNISQPHGIGYVWSTMLFEMYWNLIDRHGFNADIYDDWTTGGNNLALQLVIDGLKLQPCRPGFVDGRDAVLRADDALTGTGAAGTGANQCEIWRAFAKRGLGASADQGLSSNRNDGVAAFDLPASCTAATFGAFQPPIAAPPAVNTADAGDVVPVKFTLAGDVAFSIDSQPVDCTTLVATGEAPSPISSPGGSGIKQKGESYHVNWQTDAAWAGSCRRLTLRVPAASDAVAFFRFE